eukprot:7360520-Lingulodinium_polyedra.AAC.1
MGFVAHCGSDGRGRLLPGSNCHFLCLEGLTLGLSHSRTRRTGDGVDLFLRLLSDGSTEAVNDRTEFSSELPRARP